MDLQILLSNMLVLLILAPMMTYALMPLSDSLRFSRKKTGLVGGVLMLAIIGTLSLIGTRAELPVKWLFIMGMVPTFLVYVWLVKEKMRIKVFCFFNSSMIAGNSLLYGMILAAPIEKDGSYITMVPLSSLICLGVALALGVVYFKTLGQKIPYLIRSGALTIVYTLAMIIVIFITVMFFWVMPNYATVVMTGRVRSTILVFLLLGPGTFLLVYHTMWRVAVNLNENARLREANELMAMERKRYEELRAYMDEVRNLRHDFRQHLVVIDEYARKGETEKLSDYISQFTETLNEHRPVIAANPAVDAVASHYETVAEMQNTHIKWMMELSAELPLKESDFITVFGNLVENALIAVSNIPEEKRTVQVNARMLSDAMLGITVKNPYEGKIKLNRQGLPVARKAGHGIGLQSVKGVVDRYGGALDIETDDGMFVVGVLLYV